MLKTYLHNEPFTVESGTTLPRYHLAYSTYGTLNESKDNVVWVFHALTANSEVEEWWPGLVGHGKLFSPAEYFIICVNMPGSCYGSIGPLENSDAPFNANGSIAPDVTENHYAYHNFPFFTTRDMIRAYQPLRKHLGISRIYVGIGGSMGGQQLLEWAVEEPELFEYIFPIATNAFHSPWGIAFNTAQRQCIEADVSWLTTTRNAGMEGMKVARSVALLSYRNYQTYQLRQAEPGVDSIINFRSDSYQRYQGEKLARRFNAFSYYKLSQSMDAHHVGRARGSAESALGKITAKTLVLGITTDILFPVQEQQFIAANTTGAGFETISSLYGHDGFLLEYEQISKLITAFLKKNTPAGNRNNAQKNAHSNS